MLIFITFSLNCAVKHGEKIDFGPSWDLKGLTIIAATTAHPMEDEILRQAVRCNEWHQNPSDTAKPMKINKKLACLQPDAPFPQEKSENAPSPIFLRGGDGCTRAKKSKIYQVKSRLSLIVRVNVVLTRTVVVDSDRRFDNLCGSHLQSQSELYHVS